MKVTLKIFENEKEILTKVLPEGIYRFGRSEFSDIVLPHDVVSRSHVELRITENAVYITNMAPAGRLKLDGEVVETGQVSDGSDIGIGPYRVLLFHGDRQEDEKKLSAASNPEVNALQSPLQEEEPEPAPNEPKQENTPVLDFPEGGRGGGSHSLRVAGQGPPPLYAEGGAALRAETVVEEKPVVAKLLFTEGIRTGQEISLEAYEVNIGRSRKADIFLDDEKLSRLHCKISRVGLGYRLIDLSSRNGTFVNGMRVLEHPLTSFDQIEIGNNKIKFLIHDVGAPNLRSGNQGMLTPLAEDTRSVLFPQGGGDGNKEYPPTPPLGAPSHRSTDASKNQRVKILAIAVGLLLVIFFLFPSKQENTPSPTPTPTPTTESPTSTAPPPAVGIKSGQPKQVPGLPKEFLELDPAGQRLVEGHYNSAKKAAEAEQYSEALIYLKKVREVVPFYKDSSELRVEYDRKLQDIQRVKAIEDATKNQKEDLRISLEEGKEYLKQGDFDRAAEAFYLALGLDPKNQTALLGIKAVEYRVRDLDKVPAEKNPEDDKKKLVEELRQKAVSAFYDKNYSKAIEFANEMRKIEIKGETQYLNEAKQIIDRAKMLRANEFESFLVQAKERYQDGDYMQARNTCEEMLARDPDYEDAAELLKKAKKQLLRLAKEAYTYAYILESMNRTEEAKQYLNRALNYVKPGDEYYDKVRKKLDYYQ